MAYAGPVPAIEPPAAEPPKTAAPPDTQAATTPPTRSPSGKSLLISEESRKLGTVYHTLNTGGKQVTFTSKAHNATFDGHSSGVLGFAIAGGNDNPGALKGGAWIMPVTSLDTGNSTKNKNMRKPEWLGSVENPDIYFVLAEVKDSKPHKSAGDSKSFQCTLVGDMTIRGKTNRISIPDAVLGFVPASDKTAAMGKGDLLAIRCKYKVTLTDFGIDNEYVTKNKTVADEIEIDQSLVLSTVAPEEQPAKPGTPVPERVPDAKDAK
jgi:hypothetical protein